MEKCWDEEIVLGVRAELVDPRPLLLPQSLKLRCCEKLVSLSGIEIVVYVNVVGGFCCLECFVPTFGGG